MLPEKVNREASEGRLLAATPPASGQGNVPHCGSRDSTAAREALTLDAGAHPADNAAALGRTLARFGDLFAGDNGLVGLPGGGGQVFHVRGGQGLARLLLDRVLVTLRCGPRKQRGLPTRQLLGIILGTEQFLGNFRPVDLVTAVHMFLPDFILTVPGYNAGGTEGDRASSEGRRHGIGVVLSAHREETFATETEAEKLTLRLERKRKRFVPGTEPETGHCFLVVSCEQVPAEHG